MNYALLANTLLFRGMSSEDIRAALACLDARQRRYQKGETVLRMGDTTEAMGLVLSGGVLIESEDVWGNRSVLGHAAPGQIFAETYACIPGEAMMVSVTAAETGDILFLTVSRLFSAGTDICAHRGKLLRNLLRMTAQKNLGLSRRILHTSAKTIRGRLSSYLSEQSRQAGGQAFSIPFNRQQLADYLGVDRSALSNELSKMRAEGLIAFDRSSFTLLGEAFDAGQG